MQKCIHNGKPVYAFNVLGINSVVNHEFENILRVASPRGELKCVGCGSTVTFRFGERNKPHFAHKNDSTSGGCGYSEETEVHIEGKKMILNHLKMLYPKALVEMRYYLKEINRYSDVFAKFPDGKELAIEFQKGDIDIESYRRKKDDYTSINLKNLWIISDSEIDIKNNNREYMVSFFNRLLLNEKDKQILILNTQNGKLIVGSTMVYVRNGVNFLDKIFYKSYKLKDINITIDGNIECDFNTDYNKSLSKFIKECEDSIEKERKRKKSPNGMIAVQDFTKSMDNIVLSKDSRKLSKNLSPEGKDALYRSYEKLIMDDILNQDKKDLIPIISGACTNNSSIRQFVKDILDKEARLGNKKVIDIYNQIIKTD